MRVQTEHRPDGGNMKNSYSNPQHKLETKPNWNVRPCIVCCKRKIWNDTSEGFRAF